MTKPNPTPPTSSTFREDEINFDHEVQQPSSVSSKKAWMMRGCFYGVALIICGFLLHSASKSFENQARKAREAEAKTYMGSILRGQQAHMLETRSFTDRFQDLRLGVPPETENYAYDMSVMDGNGSVAVITATTKRDDLRSFIGIAFISSPEELSMTQLCIADAPGSALAASPELTKTDSGIKAICAPGSQPLN